MNLLNRIFRKKTDQSAALPPDMEEEFKAIYAACSEYTMTSVERMYALYKAVEYIEQKKIAGSIVECGVWRGGSSMLAAMALARRGAATRDLYLYDTYEGMTQPGQNDVRASDSKPAAELLTAEEHDKLNSSNWCIASIEEVESNLRSTGYSKNKLHFIKGKVEDTIPTSIPGKIALLRLDTDWFESTYHELVHLFPLLEPNGVLIIDDYGHWKGSRMAVDKYFAENNIHMLLNRIDYTGRIAIRS